MFPTAYGSSWLWGFFVPIREQNKLSNYKSMGKLCHVKSMEKLSYEQID